MASVGKRVMAGEDAQDDIQLEVEQELQSLQRQLHVMEGDRRAYSEESCNQLRKQRYARLGLYNTRCSRWIVGTFSTQM